MTGLVRWVFICTLAAEAWARATAGYLAQDRDPSTPYQVLTAQTLYSAALWACGVLTLLSLPRRPAWSAVAGMAGGFIGAMLSAATGVTLIVGAIQNGTMWMTAPALLAVGVAHLIRVAQCGSRLNPHIEPPPFDGQG